MHDNNNGTEKKNLFHSIYLIEIFKGMMNTLKHFWLVKKFTVQYPEEKLKAAKGYRGEHRLKKDDQGRPKCVACFMCATACPAECIHIKAGESPWPDRDKYPEEFEIDLLRCIYCGYCELACPCDAIELTETFNIVSTTRGEKLYNKEKLLNGK